MYVHLFFFRRFILLNPVAIKVKMADLSWRNGVLVSKPIVPFS